MLTHRNLVANALQLRNWCGGEDGAESLLGVLPFFHAYGLTVSLLTSWAKCSTLHLYPRFETRAVLNLIETQRPEIVPAVPAMLLALNNLMRGRPARSVVHPLRHLRGVGPGGERPRRVREPRRRRHRRGLRVDRSQSRDARQPAGRSQSSRHDRQAAAGHRSAAGRSRHGRGDVADGEVGELVVRGPQIMKGYFNNPLGHRGGAQGRLAVHRRHGPPRCRGLLHPRRSQKRHYQDVGLSGVPGGGGGGAARLSRRGRGRRGRRSRTTIAASWSRR